MKRARERASEDGALATAAPGGACPAWASACVCVSGSIAAVKAPEIARALLRRGVSVDLVVTRAAHSLLQATYRGQQPWQQLEQLSAEYACSSAGLACASTETPSERAPAGRSEPHRETPTLQLWRDEDEWSSYDEVGRSEVVHVELAKRNRLLLVAPLCANALASLSVGTASNMLSSVARAWYYDLNEEFAGPLAERYGEYAISRPVLVAPAMNTFMWHQRITGTHLGTLEERGVTIVPPIAKRLACGDTGVGAMAEVHDIVDTAVDLLRKHVSAEERALADGKPPFVP